MQSNTTTSSRIIRGIARAIIAAFMLTAPAGCAGLDGALAQASAWRDNAQGAEQDLRAQIETLAQQRAEPGADPARAAQIDAAIASAEAQAGLLAAAIERADGVLAEASDPADPLTRAARAISPWIPAPAQGPVVLGAALLATLVRSRKLKESATSIIRSIEHTMERDPDFKRLFAQHADTIRTIQTPAARKLIDATARKSPAIAR